MPAMISARRASVCSKLHESRLAFCCISSAEVATPPALAALPGANDTPASRKWRTPTGVVGMLAPSATTRQPLAIRASASLPESSFCVAHGMATRSEEHTSELQSLMRISYAVFLLKKKKKNIIREGLPQERDRTHQTTATL